METAMYLLHATLVFSFAFHVHVLQAIFFNVGALMSFAVTDHSL
jgi:hypothetical protein